MISLIIYQILLSTLIIYVTQLTWYKLFLKKILDSQINQTIYDVVNEFEQNIETIRPSSQSVEEFQARLYQLYVMLNENKPVESKSYEYELLVLLLVSTVVAASRVTNDFEVFDIRTIFSTDVLFTCGMILIVTLLYNYSFYVHFLKNYRDNQSKEILLNLLKLRKNATNPNITCE